MTDQDRARSFSDRWGGPDGPLLSTDEEQSLAEEFSATRLNERRAIVAFLRCLTWPANLEMRDATDAIERGAHGS